jgi:hypothetical protein
MGLFIHETLINKTRGHRHYDEVTETQCETIGELYRDLQAEYGRCTSKMYLDFKDGSTWHIGWCFEKRVKYTDVDETYLQEAWISVIEPPQPKPALVAKKLARAS